LMSGSLTVFDELRQGLARISDLRNRIRASRSAARRRVLPASAYGHRSVLGAAPVEFHLREGDG
jgi:hypothetical protein